ncbi:hypothetical protein PM8797T_26940 [Gimesia maris DSM 8797]|nr:hypothetical protein PM8797T_26940 [Gimesia maris DSM 8797]
MGRPKRAAPGDNLLPQKNVAQNKGVRNQK